MLKYIPSNNRMLRHPFGGEVIFLSLQHFLLNPCKPKVKGIAQFDHDRNETAISYSFCFDKSCNPKYSLTLVIRNILTDCNTLL